MQQDNLASNENPVLVAQNTDVQQVIGDGDRISTSFGNFVPSNDSNDGYNEDASAAATNGHEDTQELPVIQPADDTATTFASNESNVIETLRSLWRTLVPGLPKMLTSWSHLKKVLRNRRNVAYMICLLLTMLLVSFLLSWNKIFDVLVQIFVVYGAFVGRKQLRFFCAVSFVDGLFAQLNLLINEDEDEDEVEDEETAAENAASSALNEVIVDSV